MEWEQNKHFCEFGDGEIGLMSVNMETSNETFFK